MSSFRPDLSVERMAVILAALGTSAVVVACTKAESAAVHSDMPAAASATAAPLPTNAPEAQETAAPTDVTKNEGKRKLAPGMASNRAVPDQPSPAPPATNKGGSGQMSCGAGTCTTDPKKK